MSEDGKVTAGTFADGSTKELYRKPLNGEHFWANPWDPTDQATAEAGYGMAALITGGRPVGATAGAGVRRAAGAATPEASALPKDWKLSIGAKGVDGPVDAKVQLGIKGADQSVKAPIGHATIILEGPNGERIVAGKWPWSVDEDYDWTKADGLGPLTGMKGAIRHNEAKKVGDDIHNYAFKTYDITEEQAKSALAYIEQQRALSKTHMRYNLFNDQCATFACEVTRKAGQKPPYAGFLVERPRRIYKSIKDEQK